MNAKDAIASALRMSAGITKMLLADLSDADILVRPVEGANHIAWQIGHLVGTEGRFLTSMGVSPGLPSDFDAKHSKATVTSNNPGDFYSKTEYLDFATKIRAATLEFLKSIPDSRLDEATTGPLAMLAPTLGEMFLLLANHDMMHAGQFSVVRRKLGKPVLF